MTKTKLDDNWKQIPGFSAYFVSRDGLIYSTKTNRTLKYRITSDRHHYVILCGQKRRGTKMRIHRAGLLAFVGPCPKGMECRHIDGNPANNHLENLRWGTRLENAQDRKRHGGYPYGAAALTAKLTESDVREIYERGKSQTCRSLGKEFGVSSSTIIRILHRQC